MNIDNAAAVTDENYKEVVAQLLEENRIMKSMYDQMEEELVVVRADIDKHFLIPRDAPALWYTTTGSPGSEGSVMMARVDQISPDALDFFKGDGAAEVREREILRALLRASCRQLDTIGTHDTGPF